MKGASFGSPGGQRWTKRKDAAKLREARRMINDSTPSYVRSGAAKKRSRGNQDDEAARTLQKKRRRKGGDETPEAVDGESPGQLLRPLLIRLS